jgi:hypothetical protein
VVRNGRLALSVVVAPLLGCAVPYDAVNPDLITSFGLDPARILPQTGKIVVLFENATDSPALFFAFEGVDAQDLSQDSRNFSVEVAAQDDRNEVLDCPIEIVTPGIINPDFSVDLTGAIVATANGNVSVMYTGAPLISPPDFSCGDLIVIRLEPLATGEGDQQYLITVEVRPS